MSGKHTPGPWVFEPHGGFGANDPDGNPWPFGYISTSHPSPIFQLDVILGWPSDELTANARLISAAPDLLAVAIALLQSNHAAVIAIAECVEFDTALEIATKGSQRFNELLEPLRAAVAKATGDA